MLQASPPYIDLRKVALLVHVHPVAAVADDEGHVSHVGAHQIARAIVNIETAGIGAADLNGAGVVDVDEVLAGRVDVKLGNGLGIKRRTVDLDSVPTGLS